MADDPEPQDRASPVLDLTYHAALLAGLGADARAVAHFSAAIARPGKGRSCLDGGSAIQLALEAPGPPSLGVLVRVGNAVSEARSALRSGFLPDGDKLEAFLTESTTVDATLGVWLLSEPAGSAIGFGARGQTYDQILESIAPFVDVAKARQRMGKLASATPWAITIRADGAVELHVLVERRADPASLVRSIAGEASWRQLADVLSGAIGQAADDTAWPWLLIVRLDEDGLRIGTSLPARRIETDRSRARLVTAFEKMAGPASQLDATWRLLHGAIAEGQRWVVARGVEAKIGDRGPSLRVILVPPPPVPRGSRPHS